VLVDSCPHLDCGCCVQWQAWVEPEAMRLSTAMEDGEGAYSDCKLQTSYQTNYIFTHSLLKW